MASFALARAVICLGEAIQPPIAPRARWNEPLYGLSHRDACSVKAPRAL
jgi:hypothetical protein